MTVKQRIEHRLWGYDLEPNDISQAMPIIIRQINEEARAYYDKGLIHEDNPDKETPVPDCWDMDENIFTEEAVETLFFYSVKDFALRWCIAKLNSMK